MSTALHLPFNLDTLLNRPYDAGPLHATMNIVGGATITTAESRYGGASAYFDGVADAFIASTAIDLGSQDFTIQTWVNLQSKQGMIVGTFWWDAGYRGGWGLYVDAAGGLSFRANGLSALFSASGALSSRWGIWTHIALCRSGTTWTMYVSGTPVATTTTESSYACSSVSTQGTWIGSKRTDGGAVDDTCLGYLDDLHIDVGAALYSGAFTPPDAIAYTPPSLSNYTVTMLKLPTHLSAFPNPAQSLKQQIALAGTKDIYYGGNGQIIGTTKNTPALPVARRVRLHETKSGHVIREDWSDAAGNYAFTHLSRDYTYYVVGTDHTGQYQGVVADKLVPEVMA